VPVVAGARRRRSGATRFSEGAGLPGIPGAPRVTKTGHVVFGRFRS